MTFFSGKFKHGFHNNAVSCICFELWLLCVFFFLFLFCFRLLGFAIPPSLFCFSYFSGRASRFYPRLASDLHPPTYSSCVGGMVITYHYAPFIDWDGLAQVKLWSSQYLPFKGLGLRSCTTALDHKLLCFFTPFLCSSLNNKGILEKLPINKVILNQQSVFFNKTYWWTCDKHTKLYVWVQIFMY
jgi:hypothetical protein